MHSTFYRVMKVTYMLLRSIL